MGTKRTDAFRADAVRIALTSGLTRKQVASDLGAGLLSGLSYRSPQAQLGHRSATALRRKRPLQSQVQRSARHD